MSLLNELKNRFPDFSEIVISPIINEKSNTIAWESVAYLSNRYPIGGGTHSDKEVSKRICIAETFERGFFKEISKSGDNSFLTNEFPSTCGFACGFEKEKTMHRAIAEGLERWVWSNWIDYGSKIDQVKQIEIDSEFKKILLSEFDNYKAYVKIFKINSLVFQIGIFIGFTGLGAFAGSRVCGLSEDPWEHALIEAQRNLHNFKFYNEKKDFKTNFIRDRVLFFGNNKISAERQIENAIKDNWNVPKIKLLKEYNTNIEGIYLYRCLFEDWVGWHLGDEKRFVY